MITLRGCIAIIITTWAVSAVLLAIYLVTRENVFGFAAFVFVCIFAAPPTLAFSLSVHDVNDMDRH